MKKVNKARQALLQQKRTKRNAARKGVKYDPNKLERKEAQALQTSQTSSVSESNGATLFTV
jgi:hypothetical protein